MRITACPSWTTFTRKSTRCFRSCGDLDRARAFTQRLQDTAFELEHRLHGLAALELVVDVGGKHDLVLLDEEAGSLKPDQEILGGDDLRLGLADLRAWAERPGLDPPRGQAVGQRKVDLRCSVRSSRQRSRPEGGVGEVGADCGLDCWQRTKNWDGVPLFSQFILRLPPERHERHQRRRLGFFEGFTTRALNAGPGVPPPIPPIMPAGAIARLFSPPIPRSTSLKGLRSSMPISFCFVRL